MRSKPSLRSLLALVLILSVLTLRIGSVSRSLFVDPIQNYLSQKAFMQEDEPRLKTTFFKAKRLLADFPLGALPQVERPFPLVGILQAHHPFRDLPEVYLEIFDPPDPA